LHNKYLRNQLVWPDGSLRELSRFPTGYTAQMIAGVTAYVGSLGHVLASRLGNTGRFDLDMSIVEASMCLTDVALLMADGSQQAIPRLGINRFAPTYPLGIFPCKDGWLGVTVLSPSQWQALCDLLGMDEFANVPLFQSSMARLESADVIEPVMTQRLLQYTAEELFYRGQAARIPLARVPTMQELFDVDQFVQRQAFSTINHNDASYLAPSTPFRLFATPPKFGGDVASLGQHTALWADDMHVSPDEPELSPTNELPLAGLRIVDLSMGWAGPLAARHMADMGAEVIKVESCTRFDWWRSWEATQEWIDDNGAEKSPAFLYVNRNKLDITLDLEDERGREILLNLIATADAVVENFSGSVLPKLSLDYAHLIQANPELVMVSMPAFGSDGPWAEFRAYGSTVEHSSGLPHLTGRPDDPPTMQHVAFGDSIGGLNGAAALLTALLHKQSTGKGQFVDLSQAECLFRLGAHGILHQSVLNQPPPRYGNDHPDFAPHGVYPCEGEDRWVVIQVFDDTQWSALRDLTGIDYGDTEDRIHHRGQLNDQLAAWTQGQDAKQLMAQLQTAGIPAAVLNSPLDLIDDPQLADRNYIQWLHHEHVGNLRHPSAPYRSGTEPFPVRTPAPTLGQHNIQVLGGILGITTDELMDLERRGVIGDKPRLRD
jgi:crotonobetainyl-CoA:carnitine CoA-transferase CaiB-like acyl-CoA transferase